MKEGGTNSTGQSERTSIFYSCWSLYEAKNLAASPLEIPILVRNPQFNDGRIDI